jgi:SAM-dependent methyltransferase
MTMNTESSSEEIRSHVRDYYGKIAEMFQAGQPAGCGCGTSEAGCCSPEGSGITTLYQIAEVEELPAEVTDISLGCGDPISLSELRPGQVVLDLGSGGGIDCFLAGQKVGPTGKVIGVDMTPAMLDRARANKQKMAADNVEFRLGEIEHLPVADTQVDVIISNCVINLSPDKPQVFREAYRVLKPGGKLAVSDIVTDGPLPAAVRESLSAWASCVAGALDVKDYLAAIQQAGFGDISLSRTYLPVDMVEEGISQLGEMGAQVAASETPVAEMVFSARITALKPLG